MRARRAGVQRLKSASSATVAPGQWIRVPVPGEPFPVHFRIGARTYPAFIEHEGTQTIAQVRCPHLAPGNHDIDVVMPIVADTFTVVITVLGSS